MKTMTLIDRFGYTMQHLGNALAEAAEYRERSEWIEAHRANQKAEEYRLEAQRLRILIKQALSKDGVFVTDADDSTATILEFPKAA